MPRYAQGPPVPPTVAGLVDSLGANSARLAIILHIQTHPGTTRGDLTTAMGIGHQTVYSHLKTLENAGIVVTDVPPAERHGRTVRYWLRSKKLRAQLHALLDQLA